MCCKLSFSFKALQCFFYFSGSILHFSHKDGLCLHAGLVNLLLYFSVFLGLALVVVSSFGESARLKLTLNQITIWMSQTEQMQIKEFLVKL